MKSFLIALQFLTRLPVRLEGDFQPREVGRSLLYYPVVGLCLGLLLLLSARVLAHAGGLLPAAGVLACWVTLTGALHLDGLADSADAWAGGLGNRERTLSIMKDSNSGPVAVVALVLLLLLKLAALERIITLEAWSSLIFAPVMGRSAALLLFLTTPYVRSGGLGSALAEYLPRKAGWWVSAGVAATALLWLQIAGVWAMLVTLGVFIGLRAMAVRRIGGITGDVAGALIESVECAVLFAFAWAA
ncbi:adenosylcobinamide-GDP ribazoletransferase [Methylococcus sp. EFPC2]|uniref:adenosylcobinamide-GDP ribazoletransferase n=1 Tax=Methylococcus sp. EFPC2 TaxID=2812648 RepID=UPI001F076050|nr:adenosylcobinamide-GDP ribazoletransferase [Methylococcus sp. EFPC2]